MIRKYPDSYGKKTSALPDILGPLNIDNEGDKLVPRNDMAEVAGAMCDGERFSRSSRSSFIMISKDGSKGSR